LTFLKIIPTALGWRFAGITPAVAVIHASIIQGSALGPASYVATAADVHPIREQNRIFQFADDTYLVVPGVNTTTCQEEILHLQTWAADNNLNLNSDKTKEIVFAASPKTVLRPPRPDVERVSSRSVNESEGPWSSLRILDVVVNDNLTAADHVTSSMSSSSCLLFAMRVLRAHGTPAASRHLCLMVGCGHTRRSVFTKQDVLVKENFLNFRSVLADLFKLWLHRES